MQKYQSYLNLKGKRNNQSLDNIKQDISNQLDALKVKQTNPIQSQIKLISHLPNNNQSQQKIDNSLIDNLIKGQYNPNSIIKNYSNEQNNNYNISSISSHYDLLYNAKKKNRVKSMKDISKNFYQESQQILQQNNVQINSKSNIQMEIYRFRQKHNFMKKSNFDQEQSKVQEIMKNSCMDSIKKNHIKHLELQEGIKNEVDKENSKAEVKQDILEKSLIKNQSEQKLLIQKRHVTNQQMNLLSNNLKFLINNLNNSKYTLFNKQNRLKKYQLLIESFEQNLTIKINKIFFRNLKFVLFKKQLITSLSYMFNVLEQNAKKQVFNQIKIVNQQQQLALEQLQQENFMKDSNLRDSNFMKDSNLRESQIRGSSMWDIDMNQSRKISDFSYNNRFSSKLNISKNQSTIINGVNKLDNSQIITRKVSLKSINQKQDSPKFKTSYYYQESKNKQPFDLASNLNKIHQIQNSINKNQDQSLYLKKQRKQLAFNTIGLF